jgi:sugar lactone lactonase YvrE
VTTRPLALLVDGLGFGESPRWHDGRFWYSDFLSQRVSSVVPGEQPHTELELADRPSGLGWLPDGRLLVVSMHQQAVLRREADGTLTLHADLSSIASGDVNDMVVAGDGTAYVGNFGSNVLAGEPLRPAQLALVRPDGSVSVAAEGLAFPNGSVITPDGAVLIVGETLAARYTAFPIGEGGVLGEGRVWAEVEGRSPDGCTLDADGAIWFADASGGGVVRVKEGGEIVDVIETPNTAYACALGGDDGKTLFIITCSSPPMPGLAAGSGKIWTVEVDVPHAGRP